MAILHERERSPGSHSQLMESKGLQCPPATPSFSSPPTHSHRARAERRSDVTNWQGKRGVLDWNEEAR